MSVYFSHKVDDDLDQYYKNIIDAMMSDPILKKGLREKSTKRPFLYIKELHDIFTENLKTFHPIDDLIQRIKILNIEFKNMSFLDFYGLENPGNTKISNRRHAQEIGFYLNLECNYPPKEWVKMLN